jgi:EAL domain-containing protein (putative c-di-GMP-specific phosphodiesterase class I)/CheY-like chemotaxis protein
MQYFQRADAAGQEIFGLRKLVPDVCVIDGKAHIRTFLRNALEELGYATCECASEDQVSAILSTNAPDLMIFGLSVGEAAAAKVLRRLAAAAFRGKILVFAPRGTSEVAAVHRLGDELGLELLPPLFTPFTHETLHARVTALFPAEPSPPPPTVDLAEAIHGGWLELWYQPKVDARSNALRGVEALARVRHPTWGIVPPTQFVPIEGDPQFRILSDFVVSRAVNDWHSLAKYGPIEIAINLPISFLHEPELVVDLCQRMPRHPGFEGMIIEINGTEVIRSLEVVKRAAKLLRIHHIAISVDDLGAEWPSLMGLHGFPFAEIKVDRTFICGCADDHLKQTMCRRILDMADGYGARTVAEGVESRTDLIAAREMEFDLVQGFLLGKPMPLDKFIRTIPQYSGVASR